MRLLLYFLTFFSVFIFSEYKNSDGKAINKSFKELMQWQRSKIEPNLSYIDISEDWKNYDARISIHHLSGLRISQF